MAYGVSTMSTYYSHVSEEYITTLGDVHHIMLRRKKQNKNLPNISVVSRGPLGGGR